MSYRLSRITTRKGDDGYSHLGDKKRLPKNHLRFVALGDLDELNSTIGLILATAELDTATTTALRQIQHDLFDLGGELCPPFSPLVTPDKITRLEQLISEWNSALPPLKEFVLPGGPLGSAASHLARTVARRAERSLVALHLTEVLRAEVLCYSNRLSDLLFILARRLARANDTDERVWEKTSPLKK